MKLTAKQDISAPADQVFRLLSDHRAWERIAIRRGAEVRRLDSLKETGTGMVAGMEWHARFAFRGRRRDVHITLVDYQPPARLGFAAETSLYVGALGIDVLRMSPGRSRVHVAIEVKPKTLAARLMLQSLRLAKSRLERRLHRRLVQLANDMENRLPVAQV